MSDTGTALATSTYGLEIGSPRLESVGPLAFGPPGILFVADNVGAAIFAIGLGEADAAEPGPIEVDKLDTRLAAYLGCPRDEVFIRDLKVRPATQDVYLSVTRGSGVAALSVLLLLRADGTLAEAPL